MKAAEAILLDFIRKSPQLIIPIYQRTYSWTEPECRQLFADIQKAGSDTSINAHFIGSIVYIQKSLYQVSETASLLMIDGQQRLTTVTLLLLALMKHLQKLPKDKQEIKAGFSPAKIFDYYLINHLEEGNARYKLLLSETDKDTLISLIDGIEVEQKKSITIINNYNLFDTLLEDFDDLSVICNGLAKLMIVDVSLDRERDNPQLIFESMNSTGKELTQADLIRNYILMGLEPNIQTKIYKNYWQQMEFGFGQKAYSTHFDGFMRNYLTIKTGSIPRIGDVYDAFKKFSRETIASNIQIEEIVSEIRDFSKYYCAIVLGKEKDTDLEKAFHDIRELRVDVSFPFLLVLYKDYVDGLLSKDNFLCLIRLVEAYVFRRAICSIPTNSMNKTFANLWKFINKNKYVESVLAQFLLLPSYRRFPRDEEFTRELKQRDLYNFPRKSYWLRRIENFNRKEFVPVNEYTIEHIMPQNPKLSQRWKQDLGDEWERVHKTYLHTLGNLTLTAYNSEYSDKPFIEKRDMEGGFGQSPLQLNYGLNQVNIWNEKAILERATRLCELATKVWKAPVLDDHIISEYVPKKQAATQYTLSDHPYLCQENTKYNKESSELFELIRKEILEIDPVVTEEILKLYIAYKAEKNFVDITPLSSKLKLTLNMSFSLIQDERNKCKDVSNLGHRANGDVEVIFSSADELPYIMGLVRQSFDTQMQDGEEL